MTPTWLAGRPSGVVRRLPFLAAALCLAAACGRPPTLTETFPSDEELARAVLVAVAARDADALARMALTKDEFDDIVWPTLPASRPEVGMPKDYVWQDTFTKSRAYLAQTLASYGGQRLSLVRIGFRGETTRAPTYELSRDSYLVVTDEAGREQTVRLFGSVIRQDGRSKVYSYIVD